MNEVFEFFFFILKGFFGDFKELVFKKGLKKVEE